MGGEGGHKDLVPGRPLPPRLNPRTGHLVVKKATAERRKRNARVSRGHLELWLLTLAGLAWLLVLFVARPGLGPAASLGAWMGLVIAMTFPWLAERSRMRGFRTPGIPGLLARALFIGGYLAPWLVAGVALVSARPHLGDVGRVGAAALFVLTAGWMFSPWFGRNLAARRSPRPPTADGWAADPSTLAEGARLGLHWLFAAGLPLVACTLVDLGRPALAGSFALLWLGHSARPSRHRTGGLMALFMAMWFALAP